MQCVTYLKQFRRFKLLFSHYHPNADHGSFKGSKKIYEIPALQKKREEYQILMKCTGPENWSQQLQSNHDLIELID